MMFTQAQRQALKSGQAVPIDVDGTACVLLRQDLYDRVKTLIDDGDWDFDEIAPAVIEAWDQESDPTLDLYQEFKKSP
jgi:hypothetical protein